MSVLSQIRSAFRKVFGGGSKSSSKPRQSYSRQSTTRASRVSNYGGGGSRSYNDYSSGRYRSDYEDRQAAEQRRRQEQEQKRQATTNALASISKRTDALSSGRSSSVASSATNVGNGYKVAIKKIEQKAKDAPPDPKVKALADSNERVTNALKVKAPETMVKSGDYEYRPKANNSNAPSAGNKSTTRLTLQGYKKRMDNDVYRVAESYARGFGSDATYGVLDTLMRGNKDDKTEQDIEKYYQEHKSARAEGLGRLTGALLSFGMTGDAATSLASEIAPNFIKKGGRYAAEHLAKNPTFRKLAAKEAKKAGMELTEDVIERFAKQRAARVINAVGKDMAINWTTGGAMDVNYALRDTYDENEGNFDIGDFGKNLAKNRAINYGVGGLVTVAPALRTQKGLLKDGLFGTDFLKKGARDDALNLAKTIADERGARQAMMDTFGRNADNVRFDMNDLLKKNLKESTDVLSTPKIGEQAKAELPKMRQAMREAFVKEGDDAARRVDMNEALAKNSPFRQADEVAQQASRDVDDIAQRSVQEEAAEAVRRNFEAEAPRVEAPETGIVPKGENARATGESVRQGERTEFRRGNEETAREQARNKRTTNNRQGATQESFDKDFAAFEQKAAENQAKVESLKKQLSSATSDEEKAGIKAQIDELNSEIRREYSKASMRYHSDRGGSDEWMGRFNDVYSDYRRGSVKNRSFKGAESSTRTSTNARARARERYGAAGAGGNGNTPPPRNGATESGERGFRRPQGKAKKPVRTVFSVEDLVNKKKQGVSERERIKEAYHATKRKIVNSMASFEDANLENVKTNHEKWKANNAATDKVRRHGAIAGRSIKEGQIKANGRRFSGTVERVAADGKTYEIENGKSLMQIYDGMDEKKEAAFDAYLLLKHAPDRIREGTPIFDRIKLASNESLNDVNVINREADRLLKENPEFAKKAEEIYQYTRNELENRVNAGLLSQETASKWMHDHPFYVPTGRDGYFNAVHGNHKGIIGADPLKSATGSDLDIRSIKEQLAEATNRNWRDITTNDLLEKFFGNEVKTGMSVDNGQALLNDTIGLSKSADGRKFYAKIFRNGDMHRVEIDKRYYDDLEDLYKNGSVGPIADTVAHASSKFSTVFKKLVTSWNPFFLPKNFSRDIQDAIINTRQTKEFFECLGPAIKELGDDGEYLRAFRDSGVSQANLVNLDESLTKGKGGWLGKAVDGFATLNEATETFPRLAEFMATIKKAGYDLETGLLEKDLKELKSQLKDMGYDLSKGMKNLPDEAVDAAKKLGYDLKAGPGNIPPELIDQAAANAADVTVNFNRSGSVGKNLNKGLVPFFNPSVQGWSKFTRNFREQRGLKQLLGTIGKATMLGAGTVWVNNTLLHDNPNYQQISARDKATNFIIAWPPCIVDEDGNLRINNQTDTFIKIPRGRFAALYGLPTVNANNENDMGWAEMIKVGKDQVAPVDPLESSIYSPFLLAKKNETWYGSPIVPESIKNENNPSQEYDQNTSAIGRALGKATENLPKELQISPKKADYIIDAETGLAGDLILPALTPSKQGSGNVVEKYVTHPMGNVIKKQFTIDSTAQNDLSSRFYDKLQAADDNRNLAKATEADAEEYKRLSAYSTENSKISKAITELQNSNKPTKQEDIRGLQKVRNQLLQDALDGKEAPGQAKTMDAVQKYVGTTYAINNFGSSADQEAMKVYGLSKYGNMTEDAMRKKIDSDTSFYNGVQAIGHLEDKLSAGGAGRTTTTLAKAVALADAGADDDLFGAYKCTKKSRTETVNKMERAKTYLSSGGSVDEYVKLEKARKSLGKLSDYDKESELDKINDQLAKGQISDDEYYTKQSEIVYNANISYVGLATSLAQSNAPARGYKLYDIKDKNIQKGINLAAMGFTARDYREMAKAVDADGNGYPKKQEIIDYVANSDVADKATLYDALYYYKSSRNPFGTPTNYSRDQAAAAGKAKGVDPISDERGDLDLADDEESKKSGYGYRRRGYRRRGWRHYGHGGSSKKAKVPTPKAIKASQFTQGTALGSTTKSASTTKSSAKATPPTLKRVQAKIDLPTVRKEY